MGVETVSHKKLGTTLQLLVPKAWRPNRCNGPTALITDAAGHGRAHRPLGRDQGRRAEGVVEERQVDHGTWSDSESPSAPHSHLFVNSPRNALRLGAGVEGVEQLREHEGGEACRARDVQGVGARDQAAGQEHVDREQGHRAITRPMTRIRIHIARSMIRSSGGVAARHDVVDLGVHAHREGRRGVRHEVDPEDLRREQGRTTISPLPVAAVSPRNPANTTPKTTVTTSPMLDDSR